VTLIGEAGRSRDVHERGRSGQQYPRALDPKLPSHVLGAEAERSFERADQRVAADAGLGRELGDAVRIGVDLAHPPHDARREIVPGAGAWPAIRALGQAAEHQRGGVALGERIGAAEGVQPRRQRSARTWITDDRVAELDPLGGERIATDRSKRVGIDLQHGVAPAAPAGRAPVVHLTGVHEHEVALRDRVPPQSVAAIVLAAAEEPDAHVIVTVRRKHEVREGRLDADDATPGGTVRDERVGHDEVPTHCTARRVLPARDAKQARGRGLKRRPCAFGATRFRIPALARRVLSPLLQEVDMKCADVMSKDLEFLSERDSIERAAAVMAKEGVGFLPVCDADGRPIGVVTDRDVATRAVARRLDAATTSAAMIMTTPVVAMPADADVRLAAEVMGRERKARLVITDGGGRAVGVLSLADLIEHAPGRSALATARTVLWREALGPRGGAARGEPLLSDDPAARAAAAAESDDVQARPTVFTGGHRSGASLKEFPE
jgi:CBS domain-containing protein